MPRACEGERKRRLSGRCAFTAQEVWRRSHAMRCNSRVFPGFAGRFHEARLAELELAYQDVKIRGPRAGVPVSAAVIFGGAVTTAALHLGDATARGGVAIEAQTRLAAIESEITGAALFICTPPRQATRESQHSVREWQTTP